MRANPPPGMRSTTETRSGKRSRMPSSTHEPRLTPGTTCLGYARSGTGAFETMIMSTMMFSLRRARRPAAGTHRCGRLRPSRPQVCDRRRQAQARFGGPTSTRSARLNTARHFRRLRSGSAGRGSSCERAAVGPRTSPSPGARSAVDSAAAAPCLWSHRRLGNRVCRWGADSQGHDIGRATRATRCDIVCRNSLKGSPSHPCRLPSKSVTITATITIRSTRHACFSQAVRTASGTPTPKKSTRKRITSGIS